MDAFKWLSNQGQQMDNRKDVLSHMLNAVAKLYFKYKERKDLIKVEDENFFILTNFYIKLREYIKGLYNEEKGEGLQMSEYTKASWDERMNEIEQFQSEFSNIEKICEEDFKKLQQKIDALRKIDNIKTKEAIESLPEVLEAIEKLLLKSKEGAQNPAEAKPSEDKAHLRSSAILDSFRKKLAKFKKSLDDNEIGENIYFWEITKASWEKQMDEIKRCEHELTTVYLLGNDIVDDFEDIEKMYDLKLKELNKKIIIFKETDKAERNEVTQTQLKLFNQIQTEMHQVTQTEKYEKKSEVIANIQLSRFRMKIFLLRNSFNLCRSSNLYSAENLKTHMEKQMNEIKQLEHELATVYLLDIEKEFKTFVAEYDLHLYNYLNIKIGDFRDKQLRKLN